MWNQKYMQNQNQKKTVFQEPRELPVPPTPTKEDETSNSYSQKVRGSADGEYSLDFKVENLRLYEGDYNVDVSNKLISHWKHDEIDLSYYIALEP